MNRNKLTRKYGVAYWKEIEQLAIQGDTKAQYSLGTRYQSGSYPSKKTDTKTASKWFCKAVPGLRKEVEQGDPESHIMLGSCYRSGDGVKKDGKKAKTLWRQANSLWHIAAKQGDARAQLQHGFNCAVGNNGRPNDTEAVKWYRKAATQGLVDAQWELGQIYKYSLSIPINGGVRKDTKKAVKWIRKAADQGLAYAQTDLGDCYANGEGVRKDYHEAVKWYRKAARQGTRQGQFRLGRCYEFGQGIKQDYQEAVKWYRTSAEQNHREAKDRLARCYEYLNRRRLEQRDTTITKD